MEELFTNIIKTENGIHFLSKTDNLDHFEKDYLKVREKEGRIFSDEFVKMLPYLPQSNPLYHEWLHREATQEKFCNYLSSLKKFPVILDLGCGNGWFSMKMKFSLPDAKIIALEVNLLELKQAARVFNQEQIRFIYGDIFHDIFTPGSFDIIVLNSSMQYFAESKKLLTRLLELLKKDGEIHILDSPLYTSEKDQQVARNRTISYFTDVGVNEMAKHYHHHTFDSLQDFNYKVLYNPKNASNKLLQFFGRKISLFPWVRIINS